MIFKQRLIDAIDDGRKTMTRRPVKPYVRPRDLDWIVNPKTKARRRRPKPRLTEINGRAVHDCYYRVGHSYPIKPSRTSKAVGRVTVTSVRVERLGEITPADAKREGFARNGIGSVSMFRDYWCELYGEKDKRTGEFVPAEFDESQRVWVIEFVQGDDDQRFLSIPVPGKQGDYTANPDQAIDELPVIPPEAQARYTLEATFADELRAARRQMEWDVAHEYAAARSEAERLGVDFSHHDRAIRKRIGQMKRANDQRKKAA